MVRFSGGGVLFRWCFSIREGAAEIFLGEELLFGFLVGDRVAESLQR